MNKPKLNQPDVEQTTTTWGTTQSVSYSNYPLKNYKIDFKKHHQWPVNEIWACRNCKTRGQTFSSQTLHYCPHCGMYWGD